MRGLKKFKKWGDKLARGRVHQLAKELGMSSQELLKKLKEELDIHLKDKGSYLDEKQVKLIKELIKSQKATITLADCESLRIFVKGLLGFKELEYELPVNDTYMKVFIGRNGCGKSSLLSILGTLVMPSFLKKRLYKAYLSEDSLLQFEFQLKDGNTVLFEQKGKNIGNWTNSNEKYQFKASYGFFEPPPDSIAGVRRKLAKFPYTEKELIEKGEYLRNDENEKELCRAMNWILYGREDGKFSDLCKIPGKSITDAYLFLKREDESVIPFEFFSTGERFLLQILRHIIRTSRAWKKELPRPLIIDEVELSLHPFAQVRFIKYILDLIKKRKEENVRPHMFFLLSTHSYPIIQELVRLGEEELIVLIESHAALSKTFLIPWGEYSVQEGGRDVFSIEKRLLEASVKSFLSCKKDKLIFVVEDNEISQLLEILLADELDFLSIEAGGYMEVFQRAREISSIKELVGFLEVVAIVDGDVNEEEMKKHKEIICYKLPVKSIRKEFFSLIKYGEIRLTSIFDLILPEDAEKIEKQIKDVYLDDVNSDGLRKLWKSTVRNIRRALNFRGQNIGKDEQIEKKIIRFLVKREGEKFEEFAEALISTFKKE